MLEKQTYSVVDEFHINVDCPHSWYEEGYSDG